MFKKILVIHDNPEKEFEFQNVLESAGFGIYITEGEADGVKIADRYLPDVIICELDNYEKELEAVKKLNQNKSTESIPLILITSTGQQSHIRAAMELGADDVLLKPFNELSLLNTIKKRLHKIEVLKEKLTENIISTEGAFYNHGTNKDHILIKIGTRLKIIEFSKIVCITAFKECTKITTDEGNRVIVRKSIKNWLELLPPKDFLRIHRATIINISFLEKIEKSGFRNYDVYLKNISTPFPISQRYGNIMRKTFSY
jgi:DNA-binding LytR/AlgR family response regulator